MSDTIEKWRKDQDARGIWTVAQTWTNTYGPALRVFRELIANEQRVPDGEVDAIWDIRIGELDVDVIERYITAIWRYPSTQGKRRSTLDAKSILAANDLANAKARAKAGDKAAPEKQSMFNAKKKIRLVGTFLRWAVKKKYVSADLLTEIELALEGPQADPDGGYEAFTDEDLASIFNCRGYREDAFDNGWKYWTPKIALTTGGRVRDIADLTVHDIVIESGIPCIWFRNGVVEERVSGVIEKRLKTASAQRKAPIADLLLRHGFMEYVQARRDLAGKIWLWDDLLWEDKSGHGRDITAWFGELTKEVGIKRGRSLVFHSFRSTLNQKLEEVKLDGAVISRMLGHSPNTTKDKYYNRKRARTRGMPLEAVLKVPERNSVGIRISSDPPMEWRRVRVVLQRRLFTPWACLLSR